MPQIDLFEIEGIENVIADVVRRKSEASNEPCMTLAGSLLSSSISLLVYLLCEKLFSLTVGTGTQYRSYHMINAMISGLVIVMGLSSITEPLICSIMGVIAGIFYSVFYRIYSRNKILNTEFSIIFGIMTVAQGVSIAIFSENTGIIYGNK